MSDHAVLSPTAASTVASTKPVDGPSIGEIHPLAAANVPALARLYHRVFLGGRGPVPPGLPEDLARQFLIPDDVGISSLVYLRDGEVTGFVGAIPSRFTLSDRVVTAAILCAFMVADPPSDPMAGAKLIRAILAGPQDLTLSESANKTSVAMWRSLRGTVLPAYSLDWRKVLSPVRSLNAGLARRFALARLGLPLAGVIDAVLRRFPFGPSAWRAFVPAADSMVSSRATSLSDAASVIKDLAAAYALSPAWSDGTLDRRLAAAASLRPDGLTARVVTARNGRVVGIYLYRTTPWGTGEVLQVLAHPGQLGLVLDDMFRHAASTGIAVLRGRANPELLDAMIGRDCSFANVSATVAYARDATVLEPFIDGRALVNGLAGEAWSPLSRHSA